MAVELTSEYYASHLRRTRRSLANRYSILGRHHNNLNAFIRSGLESIPACGQVLDAGCGLSIWVTTELRKQYDIIGVDCQPESIKACQELYKGYEYKLGDLYALNFEEGVFDAIVMREVIEHFRTPERAVQEVARVLKSGGKYILTTPNYDSLLLRVIEHTYNRFFGGPCKPYKDDVHPSKFRVQSLKELIGTYFDIEQYATMDLGISLGCVARKR